MTEDELQKLLEKTLPAADLHGLFVEECQDQDVRLRFPFDARFLGPGDVFSGPALLSFADTALYAAVQAAIGTAEIALTSNLNVTFLKPAQAAEMVALSRVIRKGRRTAHAEAWLFSHTVVDPVLHATASLSIRPR
ncbi:MAG: PaaI family thioesterase [Reyranella sp.]|nr:PaaI family thioesterase [Reyranella sp.]